ncbi:hypothetical protein K2173_003670 [Erythroxylum novogranatense]|uniref:S-adenosyl-L-methionine-dependent methyltransferase superfamily protein n=1 Tax=Erythroxylum novogranatense TaxID=1862640 RepID=A0AAV8TAY6_9ROSI|nr:hypothetical protein K2173_003670 [Erythroxylum novogranatense]
MWHHARLGSRWRRSLRRFGTAAARRFPLDEGDWFYSSEWYDLHSSDTNTVFRSSSDKGNGIVSVLAFPSSRPNQIHWPTTEKWLQERFTKLHPGLEHDGRFRIIGYQWRTLHFNDNTFQSTVKVMAFYQESQPSSICLMQQPHCLAVPYLKSMVSTGLATLASCKFDLKSATNGKKEMRILCIGHGGGSLPLFLTSKIKGAVIDIIEVDPLVISGSIRAMGFPAFSVVNSSGERIHERLYLRESDAEEFVLNGDTVYDMIFIDAYDGDDIFPRKLWDPDFPFLKALSNLLHPRHGTVVVNLHSDSDAYISNPSFSYFSKPFVQTSKHVSKVCQAYRKALVGNGNSSSGLGFFVSVPWVCNTSLVVCRGFALNNRNCSRDLVMNTITSKSLEIDNILNLPFSCLEYVKRDFTVID